ncbi:hypothetical protein [Sphingomonas endolithica]|uniref:hypothetical protein n=1 Tax=Sphingomonas endolithica TaxID=2972485 RepID=UPI0021AE545D|nr:hypothetical protein [Sphingomonas sp. ZFBP2030]
MSDRSPPPSSDTVTAAVDRAEAAATRRRWVTLAELVGVAGLVIAALGLWMNWSERRADDAIKQAERVSEVKVRTLVKLKASGSGKALTLADAGHDVQSIDIAFPKPLAIAAQTDIEPKIDAGWFDDALLKMTDGGPDDRTGRLPVIITAHYWDADVARQDKAIYDITWETKGRVLQGRELKLTGIKLRDRAATPARLEAVWAREKPKPIK